jgi:hypothetical protein
MMATVIERKSSARQTIETDKDREKFLRRVIREDGWMIKATADADWRVEFHRTIKGNAGDPDVLIVVQLDDKITLGGKFGTYRSFSDSYEVIIPQPRQMHLQYSDVAIAAKLMLAKAHFVISGSAGSTNSSKYGLGFVELVAILKECHGGSVGVGHQSVYVNGRMVISGSAE